MWRLRIDLNQKLGLRRQIAQHIALRGVRLPLFALPSANPPISQASYTNVVGYVEMHVDDWIRRKYRAKGGDGVQVAHTLHHARSFGFTDSARREYREAETPPAKLRDQ